MSQIRSNSRFIAGKDRNPPARFFERQTVSFVARSFRFNEAKGKTVDYVEFYTVHGYHRVDLALADQTALQFTIDPAFNVAPAYSNWKTGNQRILRSWAPIHCS